MYERLGNYLLHADQQPVSSIVTTTTELLLSPGSFLTPNTLVNIEESLAQLQSSRHYPGTHDGFQAQSGFVPPLPESTSSSYGDMERNRYSEEYSEYPAYGTDDDSTSCSDPEWLAPREVKRPRMAVLSMADIENPGYLVTASGRHTGPRRPRDEKLNPEEEAKRRTRRERNKYAAAKCRQRRVDHTNRLLQETEALEEDRSKLESEIETLQQQKEQYEFILKAHRATCARNQPTQAPAVKLEPRETQSRPTSLPIMIKSEPEHTSTSMNFLGISITTPSTGLFSTLGLDNMVDGHTGLTPLTGVALTSISTPSCSTQAQRNLSDSCDGVSSPSSLVAL